MALPAHRLHHTQRGQRVDERGGARRRRRAFRQCQAREASTRRYCAYMAPPATATVLPANAWASAEDPALTTVPAPSFPTGIDLPTRPARALIAAADMLR